MEELRNYLTQAYETDNAKKQNFIHTPQGTYVRSKRAMWVVALAAGAELIIGGIAGAGIQKTNEREQQRIAAQSPLELTCDQFSKQGTSVRLPDGSIQKLTCDENGVYGIPATQERGQ